MENPSDKDLSDAEAPLISDEDGENALSEIRAQYEEELESPPTAIPMEVPRPARPLEPPRSQAERQISSDTMSAIMNIPDSLPPVTVSVFGPVARQARREAIDGIPATMSNLARANTAETEGMRFAMALSRAGVQPGAPPRRTMEVLRGTGRTTRMIAEAIRLSSEGTPVVIVAEGIQSLKRLESLCHEEAIRATVISRKHIDLPHFVTSDDPSFSWEPHPSYTALPDAVVMVDHFAIEHDFTALVSHLHSHDPQVMVGAAGCRHIGAIATPIPQLLWCPVCGSLIFDGVTYCPKAVADIGERTT